MQKKARLYIIIAGVLLFITAIAKLVSATGSAKVLSITDPILCLPFRDVFVVVGVIELGCSMICLFGKRLMLQAVVISWLATNFLLYQIGLIWMGYHKPCKCLGNLTDALHIPPQFADIAVKTILAYLLFGSYVIIVWLWWRHKQENPAPLTAQ